MNRDDAYCYAIVMHSGMHIVMNIGMYIVMLIAMRIVTRISPYVYCYSLVYLIILKHTVHSSLTLNSIVVTYIKSMSYRKILL